MERVLVQNAVVGQEGLVELSAPELVPGTEVEVILIVRGSQESERERLVRAILEGEVDVAAGRTRPSSGFFTEHAQRYGLPG